MPTLLAVIPHPDDESYSFGGTIALAARAGWRCEVVCVSSGEQGKRHDGAQGDSASLGSVREAELAASCVILGAAPPQFLRLPDGRIRDDERALAASLAEAVTVSGADVVLGLGEDGAYGHPDHLAVYRALASLRAPRPTLAFAAFPRGLFVAQYERCIGMMGVPPVPPAEAIGAARWDYEVDIRAVSAVKLAAVAAHRSQLPAGDPHALFPGDVIGQLLDRERFVDARGGADGELARTFAALGSRAD